MEPKEVESLAPGHWQGQGPDEAGQSGPRRCLPCPYHVAADYEKDKGWREHLPPSFVTFSII